MLNELLSKLSKLPLNNIKQVYPHNEHTRKDFIANFIEPIAHDESDEKIHVLDIYYNEIGRFLSGKLKKELFIKRGVKKIKNLIEPILYKRALKRYPIDEIPEQIDAFIHVSDKSHLREFLPVYKVMKKRFNIVFITPKISVIECLEESEVIFLTPLYQVATNKDKINNDYYKGIDDKIERYPWSKDVLSFLNSRRYEFNLQIKWYSNLIYSFQPKFILVGNDLTSEGRLFTRIASSQNVTTFSVQHGNIYRDWIGRHHIVDYFFTYGKSSSELFNEIQLGNTKAVSCGSPFIGSVLKNKLGLLTANKYVLKRHSIPGKYVLVAFSGYGHLTSKENYFKCLHSVNDLVKSNSDEHFIFKLHPKEKIDDYKAIQSNHNATIISSQEKDISELSKKYSIFLWLVNAKTVITGSSTVAIEALMMSVPVISMDYCNEYREVNFRDKGVTINVSTHKELEKCFSEIDEIKSNYLRSGQAYISEFYENLNKDIAEIISNNIIQKINIW